MNYQIYLVCAVLAVQNVICHQPDITEFCSNLLTQTADIKQCQGKPGKKGPKGDRGPVGKKGERGEPASYVSLQNEVSALKDTLRLVLMRNPDVKLNYCEQGMKNGDIPESAISASSQWDNTRHRSHWARLDAQIINGVSIGAWCAKTNRVGEWIQVDLGEPKMVAGLVTQGRPVVYKQWLKTYKVACGTTAGQLTTLTVNGVEKVFIGNTDEETKVVNKFPKPMLCRYIRIYPQTWNVHICARFEVLRGDCFDYY